MSQRFKKYSRTGESGLKLSVEGLKGRQSVRATFSLPEEMIELFALVAAQFGVKQKSLFDQLVEDSETLEQVVVEAGGGEYRKAGRRPKTLVVSKRALDLVETVARKQGLPRDVLVELSLRRLVPLLRQEQQKHSSRVRVSTEAEEFHQQSQVLLRHVEDYLGRDDQVYDVVAGLVEKCRETSSRLQDIVSRGESVLRYRNGATHQETKRQDLVDNTG